MELRETNTLYRRDAAAKMADSCYAQDDCAVGEKRLSRQSMFPSGICNKNYDIQRILKSLTHYSNITLTLL